MLEIAVELLGIFCHMDKVGTFRHCNNALSFCPSIHVGHFAMSDYLASEACSHDDFWHVLDRLKLLLENLPQSLPEKSLLESRFACFLQLGS